MSCRCPECHNSELYYGNTFPTADTWAKMDAWGRRHLGQALDKLDNRKDTPMKRYALKSVRGVGYVAGYGPYGFSLTDQFEHARMFESISEVLRFVSGRRPEIREESDFCGRYNIIRTKQIGWVEDGVVS